MNDRALLRAQLMKHEGLRLRPYLDTVGKLTIGYGRNLDDVGITKAEAEHLLTSDIDHATNRLVARHPWVEGLDPVRQAVLVNMAFNLGIDGLSTFHQMLRAAHQDRFGDAANHMLDSKWAKQVGPRAVELAEQMRTGAWA